MTWIAICVISDKHHVVHPKALVKYTFLPYIWSIWLYSFDRVDMYYLSWLPWLGLHVKLQWFIVKERGNICFKNYEAVKTNMKWRNPSLHTIVYKTLLFVFNIWEKILVFKICGLCIQACLVGDVECKRVKGRELCVKLIVTCYLTKWKWKTNECNELKTIDFSSLQARLAKWKWLKFNCFPSALTLLH